MRTDLNGERSCGDQLEIICRNDLQWELSSVKLTEMERKGSIFERIE